MDRFLFAGDQALATDQATIAAGQLGIFVELTNGNSKMFATGDSVKRFCIMLGGSVAGKRSIIATPYMDARPRRKIMKKANPIAGVKQAIRVQFAAKGDSTSGSSTNDEFIVTADLRGGMDLFGNESQARTYTVRGFFPTLTDLYNAIAAQINGSDTYRDLIATVTGSAGTLGVTITPTDAYANATIYVGAWHQPFSDLTTPQLSTITETAAFTPSSGTVADAKRLDIRQQASLGNFYQVDSDLPQLGPLVQVDGATYKSLYLYVEDVHHTTDMQAKGNVVYAQTTIYMPNASTTNYAAVIAALEEILAGTFVESDFA